MGRLGRRGSRRCSGHHQAGEAGKVTGVDAVAEAIAQIQAGGSMLATVEQPWPSILDMVIEAMVAYQESGDLPAGEHEAVDTTLVNYSTQSTSPRRTS